jgi:hypothetical protein
MRTKRPRALIISGAAMLIARITPVRKPVDFTTRRRLTTDCRRKQKEILSESRRDEMADDARLGSVTAPARPIFRVQGVRDEIK